MSTPEQPPVPRSARWWVDALWLLALAVGSGAWCLNASVKLGVTYDEPFYLDAGLDAWHGWDHDGGEKPDPDGPPVERPAPRFGERDNGTLRGFDHHATAVNGVMPLPIDAVTLPLYLHEKSVGKNLPDGKAKLAKLRWARAVTLGWLWLLVFSAWRLGRAAGGPWAGRIASGLIACDPNFLGHASLATTDIAVTATLTAFARAVYAGRSGGWWKRLLLPGLWFGAAATCKISALLYGGIILVALEVCYRFASGGLSCPAGGNLKSWARVVAGSVVRSVLNAAAILAIGITLAVTYFGIPDEGRHPFAVVAGAVPPNEPLKPKYEAWAEKSGRVPHAACAFAFQWWYNAKGRPTFLNGTFYPEGYRYYFPEVLLMKVPLPLFALALVALPRLRTAVNPFALVALLLLGALLTANLQIGVRLAFPVMALGYVAIAVALARGYPRCAPWIGLPAILVVAATSIWVWPNGLGYLNQAHGGPKEAHRRVTDSNVDWGHGVPELTAWWEANDRPLIWVWYFGTDPAVYDPPYSRFPLEVQKPEITTPEELRAAVGPRFLAVGHTVVTLHPHAPPAKAMAVEYLKTRKPYVRTSTFTVYDFRDLANGPPPLE